MTLGANQIAAHAADLLDLEEQIEALQTGKRDAYKALRDEHGKAEANALKQAVKLSRMDSGKRDEAAAVDTEAMRMLAIIERAARAPRATPAIAKTVPDHDALTGEIIETNSDVPTQKGTPRPHEGTSDTGSSDANNPGVAAGHINSAVVADQGGEGTDPALSADTSLQKMQRTPPAAIEALPVEAGGTAVRHMGGVA